MLCVSNARSNQYDSDTRLPQVVANGAYHLCSRLAWRGRRLSVPRHRRSDQPGCSDGECRLSCDGMDYSICYLTLEHPYIVNRSLAGSGHAVGIVPILLGLSET